MDAVGRIIDERDHLRARVEELEAMVERRDAKIVSLRRRLGFEYENVERLAMDSQGEAPDCPGCGACGGQPCTCPAVDGFVCRACGLWHATETEHVSHKCAEPEPEEAG